MLRYKAHKQVLNTNFETFKINCPYYSQKWQIFNLCKQTVKGLRETNTMQMKKAQGEKGILTIKIST